MRQRVGGDDRPVVLHQHHLGIAERLGHGDVRAHAVVGVGGLLTGEADRRDVVVADHLAGGRQGSDVRRVHVDDRLDVGAALVDRPMESHGRGKGERSLGHREVPVEQRDVVGPALVEVAEARRPEPTVARGAHRDLTADVRVTALPEQDPPADGDQPPRVIAGVEGVGRHRAHHVAIVGIISSPARECSSCEAGADGLSVPGVPERRRPIDSGHRKPWPTVGRIRDGLAVVRNAQAPYRDT